MTLLIRALMLLSTLRNLRSVDLGFDPRRVTVIGFNLGEHGYDTSRAMAYHRDVLPALQASGDFESVSLSFRAPFGPRRSIGVIPPGRDSANPLSVAANGVSDNYFR